MVVQPVMSSSRIVIIAMLLLAVFPLHAFDSGSSGSDGELAPREDVQVVLPADGILNYTRVSIPTGVRVTFKKNTANTPVRMLVTGNVGIAGVIDVSGERGAVVGLTGNDDPSDDGEPGAGGPGGYDGGAGGGIGVANTDSTPAELLVVAGEAGKGPGGGFGGSVEFNNDNHIFVCNSSGGNHAEENFIAYTPRTYPSIGIDDGCVTSGLRASTVTVIDSYGTSSLVPLTGGSGGGGGRGGRSFRGSGGGGGGGALLIAASGTVSIHGSGRIIANGGGAGSGDSGSEGNIYNGGNGSGGAVRIVATTIAGNGLIEVNPGHNLRAREGGRGRIRLEAENLNYSNRRVRYSSSTTPGQLFISNRPYLRVESVSAVTAPLSPSGSSDIVLEQSSDPVQVSIAASNIPPGTEVSLRVVPDYGSVVTASGSALSGTVASRHFQRNSNIARRTQCTLCQREVHS